MADNAPALPPRSIPIMTTNLIFENAIAKVLFDSGASTSFISPTFKDILGLISQPVARPVHISTGNGICTASGEICRGYAIIINERLFPCNLTVLKMKGQDIVLGMDWLTYNNATSYSATTCHRPLDQLGGHYYLCGSFDTNNI